MQVSVPAYSLLPNVCTALHSNSPCVLLSMMCYRPSIQYHRSIYPYSSSIHGTTSVHPCCAGLSMSCFNMAAPCFKYTSSEIHMLFTSVKSSTLLRTTGKSTVASACTLQQCGQRHHLCRFSLFALPLQAQLAQAVGKLHGHLAFHLLRGCCAPSSACQCSCGRGMATLLYPAGSKGCRPLAGELGSTLMRVIYGCVLLSGDGLLHAQCRGVWLGIHACLAPLLLEDSFRLPGCASCSTTHSWIFQCFAENG